MARSSDKVAFYSKVSLPDENGCMRWLGALYPNGYGKAYISRSRITDLRREQGAHVLSYRFLVGEISTGNVIMHSCDNRWCVSPIHLIQGTQQENMDDMHSKGRWEPYRRQERTHCKKGHLYTEESTYVYRGRRTCNTCRLNRDRKKSSVDPSKYRKKES